ncbi:MAG TPA: histidine kinase [Streptosporangiaceae bacterium]|nr:histidine kinase [Streptosporangiaceae bacterium]
MNEEAVSQGPRAWLASVLAFVRWSTPREPVPRGAIRADIVLAFVTLILALVVAKRTYSDLSGGEVAAAMFASVPLAARRRFPLAAFLVLVVGVFAARQAATDLSFLTMLLAAYSAVVHSRFRGLSLLCVALAGVLVAYVFWKGQSGAIAVVPMKLLGPGGVRIVPGPGGVFVPQGARWRLDALVALVALVGIAIVGAAGHARERIRRLQAEHAAATERALEAERARIASELHDVVTHNVSVMIVQAGAARQVLDAAPQDARAALLAVESSGRAAMAELRHLLGLLSPAQPGQATAEVSPAGGPAAESELRPQPGLGQLPSLVTRMKAAGLPVDLQVGEVPPSLPPGLDLAAFRVVQEALTNVLKHAGKPATTVRVDCSDGSLLLEVTDAGRSMPSVGPVAVPGSGRGLFGLRERVAVYGGEVDAGPQPGGGWRVRARIPVEAPAPVRVNAPGLTPAAGR